MSSYASTIMARLGLDTKAFSDGLRNANRDTDQHTRTVNNSARAHENLLRSSHRVSRQISNMTKDLLSGGDAMTVLADGLEAVGRSLNLNLGALAALGIGAVGIEQIYKGREALVKLNEEVEKLFHASSNPSVTTLSALETQLSKVGDELERLKKEAKGGWGQRIKDAFYENFFTENGELLPDSGKADRRRARSIAEGEGKLDATQRGIAEKRRRKNAAKGDRFAQFDPNNDEEFINLMAPSGNGYDAAARAEELAQGLKDLLQTIIKAAEDKAKLSLSDLASGPTYADANHASSQAIWNAEQARQVMQLEAQARDLSRNQANVGGANQLLSRAEGIRGGISTLKDSEKTREFADALDASIRLKNIETNTGKTLVNR